MIKRPTLTGHKTGPNIGVHFSFQGLVRRTPVKWFTIHLLDPVNRSAHGELGGVAREIKEEDI